MFKIRIKSFPSTVFGLVFGNSECKTKNFHHNRSKIRIKILLYKNKIILQMFVAKLSEDLTQEYSKKGIIVQCILPGYVATKMSKIRKPSLFSPSPKTFVDSALKTVGIESQTVGYWPHNLMVNSTRFQATRTKHNINFNFFFFQPGILVTLYGLSSKLTSWAVMQQMLQIRTRALKHTKKTSD